MTRMLIATDGSELARHAAMYALGLVRGGAEVTIVTVVSPPVAYCPRPTASRAWPSRSTRR